MEGKNFLNEQGIAALVTAISNGIINHTSGEITVTEIEDEDTGEINKEAVKPNNFTTTKAVVEYLRNRKRIKINQQKSTESSEDYDIETESINYNGEDEVQIDMKLASASDIKQLFSEQESTIIDGNDEVDDDL